MASNSSILRVSAGNPTRLSETKEIECAFNNFQNLEDKDKSVKSPIFECLGHEWSLEMYPWGSTKEAEEKEMVSAFLNMKSNDQPTKIKFSIKIANALKEGTNTFVSANIGRGWPKFVSRSQALENLDENGALICKVTVQGWFQSMPEWFPGKFGKLISAQWICLGCCTCSNQHPCFLLDE